MAPAAAASPAPRAHAKVIVVEQICAPYSMNSLISEHSQDFSGAILGMLENILGESWGLEGKLFKNN